MRFFWIITVIIATSSISAEAQQLAVRSGDHVAFSRLTVPLSVSQTWEAHQTDQEVVVTLPGNIGGFDLSAVFLRIGRNRILDIDADNETLILRTNCICDAAVFRSGSLLVIDIADQGTELLAKPISPVTISAPKKPPRLTKRQSYSATALPWIGATSPFVDESASTSEAVQAEYLTDQNSSVADRAKLLADVQKDLIVEVANAASAGLLESNIKQLGVPPAYRTQIIEVPSAATSGAPQELNNVSNNLRISNSMDRPDSANRSTTNMTTSGAVCPNLAFVSVGDWGQETEFSSQIGPARNALVNARDRVDSKAVKTLTQLYLYFGFGAEALDVLRLDPVLSMATPQLADVATILEHGAIARQNSLAAFTDCSSDVALWAILSFRDLPKNTLINTNAALLALNKLPIHLRIILAPALSERLLQYGDAQSAAAALRSIERLPDRLAPNAVMAQADLAIEAGEIADEFLENIIKANSTESPVALVKLVERKLKNGESLSSQTATLVEAYSQELRGTEIGNKLLKTQVLALSQSEQFGEAFEALEILVPSLSLQNGNQLRRAVLERLVEKATDFTFLEHTFSQSKATIAVLPDAPKLLLATRLLDLGFAAQVQEILMTMPDNHKMHAQQILAARTAIALRQPFQAQAALIGIEGADAEMLLAQAKEMTGDYSEAAELFRKNNAEKKALQAAWLSEEWRSLTELDTPAFGPVATLAHSITHDPTLGPLGQASKALEESGSARAALEILLRDPIVQITPGS